MSTTQDRYTLKTRAMAFVALISAITLMMPMAPASADPGAFVVAGQARLAGGIPSSGPGCFAGHAVGVHGGAVAGLNNASANFTYDNSDIVVGDAAGTLTIDGTSVGFIWLRVGATAVLTFSGSHGGAAVAVFVPTTSVPNPALPVCSLSGSGHSYATVAGVGIIT